MASAEIFTEATEYGLAQAFEPGRFDQLLHYCAGPAGQIAIAQGIFRHRGKLGLLVLRATHDPEDTVIYVDRRLAELCGRYIDLSQPSDYGRTMPVSDHDGRVASGELKIPGIANISGWPSIGEITYPEEIKYAGILPPPLYDARRLTTLTDPSQVQ